MNGNLWLLEKLYVWCLTQLRKENVLLIRFQLLLWVAVSWSLLHNLGPRPTYLGHIIDGTCSDDFDISREVKNLFTRTDVLCRGV